MNITTPPPDKLSDLIRLALDDLRKCEENPQYTINMHVWYHHSPDNNRCMVCLAGSVMAQTLQFASTDRLGDIIRLGCDDLNSTASRWAAGMYALNAARQGRVDFALRWWLGLDDEDVVAQYGRRYNQNVIEYSDGPCAFFDTLTSIADQLSADDL